MPANILCHDSHAATHEERTSAFGRIEFVCGERKQIATELFDIKWHAPRSLNGICVKAQVTVSFLAHFTNERAYLCDGLNRADLVIGEHQSYQYCVGSYRRAHVFCSDNAVFVNGQARNFPALLLK